MTIPHFQIPLNLPHAGTIVWRIQMLLAPPDEEVPAHARESLRIVSELRELLEPCRESGENPPGKSAAVIVARVAELGRALVDELESRALGFDRLGQCVRNLFECLELGEEGAEISLRAGENPSSAQRPI